MKPVTIVTGAAGGIGKAVASALAENGHRLVLTGHKPERLMEVTEPLRRAGHEVEDVICDIASTEATTLMAEAAVKRFGRIDALVHCAGIDAPSGKAWQLGDEHWRKVIDVDLNGAWWCTRAVLPFMLEQKAGRIILIGSASAKMPTLGTSVAYNAAKAGINGLVMGLSNQVEGSGVLVNVISPGPTGTGAAMTEAERRAYESIYPLGEGGARPVVEACLYLLGPGGDWLSGSVLNVSGGRVRG